MERINFEVLLEGACGVEATFQAESIEVVSVQPLDETVLCAISPFSGGMQSKPMANL